MTAKPTWDQRLDEAGQQLAEARAAADTALQRARTLAVAAAADGYPEATAARRLGVDRMAVRNWLGKR